jgi:hypothetical protein
MMSKRTLVTWALCVSSAASQSLAAQAPTLRFFPETHIDGHTAGLTRIGWLGVSNAGVVAVTQPETQSVVLFNSTGERIAQLGEPGMNPGQFQGMSLYGGWLADTLWLHDVTSNRLTFISPAATLVRTVTLPAPWPSPTDTAWVLSSSMGGPRPLTPRAVFPDGSIELPASRMPRSERPMPDSMRVHVLHVKADGRIDGMVAAIPPDPSRITARSGTTNMIVSSPYYPAPLYAVADDGSRTIVVTTNIHAPDSNTFRVTAIDAFGDTVYSRLYPFNPQPLPRATVERALEGLWRQLPSPELEPIIRAKLDISPVYAPILYVVPGRDGFVWLGLRIASPGRPWLLLDPKGSPVGLAYLAQSLTMRYGDATRVWVTETDTDATPLISSFRVDRVH